jgi:Kef-type K+ transport system membrane component KefB/nucleotide-binding universal stress UspA family protein
MQTFTSAPHHDIAALLIQFALLLLAARGLAELAQRVGQPAVVGEILAGIILGPSLLSGIVPALGRWVVPQTPTQGHLLELVALIGAMFLLLITGMETDLALIRRHARVSMGASIGGIVVPFVTGYALGDWLPDYLLADPGRRLVFSLFVATALSISAIPVIAKVLMDLNLMRRDIGQAIIAAGMTDDAIGWMLLSIVLGLAASGEVQLEGVLWAVGKVVGFVLLSMTLGMRLVRWSLDVVQDRAGSPNQMLTLVVALTFGWGAVTQLLGLEAVFGAFVMGIILGQFPRLPGFVRQDVERIAMAVFAPVFFAVAGLKVNALALLEPRLFGIAVLVVVVASVGKVLGGYVGARAVGGAGHWEALSFGAGMNARGAMEIIIATIGLSLGILSQDMFSIIVVMAITTSLMAPPALRWTLRHVRPGKEERERLKREEMERESFVAGVRRVLLPIRCRTEERRALLRLESDLLERLSARNRLAATLLTVTRPGSREDAASFLGRVATAFRQVELSRKVVQGTDPTEIILDEAAKDYDLLILGAPADEGDPDEVFTARVDEILRMSPCSTMVVKGRVGERHWPPRKILMPTNGSLAARHAADLAFVLAGEGGAVVLLNVMEDPGDPFRPGGDGGPPRQSKAAHEIVDELRTIGEAQGVRVDAQVRVSMEPETMILEVAEREGVDLIVLGTSVYAATKRVYLGPRVERILSQARCPIVLLNSI